MKPLFDYFVPLVSFFVPLISHVALIMPRYEGRGPRAFGLLEKRVVSFGSVVSDLGLKYHNLQVHPKKMYMFLVQFFSISDLYLEYLPQILQINALNNFSLWNIT